jgi:hypothetical protein
MDRPISSTLRYTFLVHACVGFVIGILLLLIPGRTLELLGWIPEQVNLPNSPLAIPGGTFVDPVITRLVGAALLGWAYSSLRACLGPGFKLSGTARPWAQVNILVETEVVFCLLGAAAFLAGYFLMVRAFPLVGWAFFLILIAFAVAFGTSLRSLRY